MSDARRFNFAFAPRYRVLSRPFGIKPENSWVEAGEKEFDVRFGPWRLSTPLGNVSDAAVTVTVADVEALASLISAS